MRSCLSDGPQLAWYVSLYAGNVLRVSKLVRVTEAGYSAARRPLLVVYPLITTLVDINCPCVLLCPPLLEFQNWV